MRSPYEKINLIQNNYGMSIEYTLDIDEKIDRFDNGMMTHNNISGILGYIYEANGGQRKLRYDRPKGIQLSLLMGRTLKKQVLLGILISIAQTYKNAEEYMLNDMAFLLDTQLIFVNTSTLESELIYIPTGVSGGVSFWQFVKDIMYSGIVSTEEDTSYVQQIVNYINSNQPVATDKLCEYLASIEKKPNAAPAFKPEQPVQPQGTNDQPIMQPGQPRVQSVASAPQPGNLPRVAGMSAMNIPPAAPTNQSDKSKKGRLFSGLKNKKKTEKPETPPKQSTPSESGFGFNIPGKKAAAPQSQPAPAQGGGFGFNIPGKKAAAPQAQPAPAPTQGGGFGFNIPGRAADRNNAAPEPAAEKVPVYSGMPTPPPVIEEVEPNEDQEYDGRTVLLEPGNENPGESMYYLEDKHGQRIIINKTMFFIGKGTNTDIPNDYIVKNGAVSRNHAYLQLNAGGATITDNNSSNGTFINGERIPSLVKRELKDGDVVLLADEKFTYRVK